MRNFDTRSLSTVVQDSDSDSSIRQHHAASSICSCNAPSRSFRATKQLCPHPEGADTATSVLTSKRSIGTDYVRRNISCSVPLVFHPRRAVTVRAGLGTTVRLRQRDRVVGVYSKS